MVTSALAGLSKLQIAAVVVAAVAVSAVGAVALGVVGTPSVEGVDNRFGEVTDATTIIHTDLRLHNPNPIGVRLGDTTIEYTVRMNEVPMATGGREGLPIAAGDSTVAFETEMDNDQIPSWWTSHFENGERTVVTINATVHTSILGERRFDLTQEREVETDIIAEFASDEVREVNADDPPPATSNPILYINQTDASWGTVSDDRTPIDMEFVVYNPHVEPYTVTEVGYEITMNDVPVGEGATDQVYVIPGGATQTIRTEAAILNRHLDDWWVTHLQADQVTELRIEFSAVIELPTGNEIRVPLDELTYEETIETDIFDNKANGTADGTTPTPSPAPAGTTTPQPTPTPTSTPSDDGTLDL